MNKPYIIETTVEAWIDEAQFPPYFANRDVNRRMKKAHLQGIIVSPEQAVVRAVKMGNDLIKIDGHSRAEAWRRDQLARPATLTVMVFPVENEEQIADLYKSFNSKEAAETPAEQAYHANKLCDFKPTSKLAKSSWKAAYGVLGITDQVVALKTFSDELKLVDSWGIQLSRSAEYSTGVKAAILKTLKDAPEAASVFWDLYNLPDTNVAEINQVRKLVEEHRGVSSAATVGVMYAGFLGAFAAWSAKQ